MVCRIVEVCDVIERVQGWHNLNECGVIMWSFAFDRHFSIVPEIFTLSESRLDSHSGGRCSKDDDNNAMVAAFTRNR